MTPIAQARPADRGPVRALGLAQKPLAPPPGLTASMGFIEGREVLVLSFPHDGARELDALTAAERSVAEAALSGMTNREIAQQRGRSVRTVAKQVASTLHKLGVASRSELAATIARGRGLR